MILFGDLHARRFFFGQHAHYDCTQLTDPEVANAIMGLSDTGGTNFPSGLAAAIDLVKVAPMNPSVTETINVVHLAGDTADLSDIF
jgi:hypothetical protein